MKRNRVDMLGELFYKDLKFEQDERLTRRLKRRCGTNATFKNDCPNTGVKKRTLNNVQKNTSVKRRTLNNVQKNASVKRITLNTVQKTEVMVDPDYASYLNLRREHEDYCEDDDEDHDDHDPDYVMCLKHLREYGNSYVLEIVVNDGMPMLVKYEEEGEFDDDDDENRKTLKNSKDVPSGDKVETNQVLRNIRCEKKKESPKTSRSVSSKGRKISMTEKNAEVECRTNGSARQKSPPKVCHSSMPETKHDLGSDKEDDSYESFLNCLKLDGDILVLVTEDGKQIRYEDDDENASDSDSVIVVTGDVPLCDEGIHSPFVPSKIYYMDSKESSSSKFREKLMDILRKPFDKKEYAELWQEASDRKPLERHRELRSGVTKRCPILESLSKSYLDHYVDLKNEVDSVRRSHYMVLNLLRGFFYWLKNLSQEGAFRPWLDESCLKLIRQL